MFMQQLNLTQEIQPDANLKQDYLIQCGKKRDPTEETI